MFDLSKIKLKSCPFCGRSATLKHRHWCVDMQFDDDHDLYYVECNYCGSKGAEIEVLNARYHKTMEKELNNAAYNAIEAWNQRATNNKDDDNYESIHKQNDMVAQTNEIHIGEVVYTKSSVCVLDIGLVERLNPLRVYSRSNRYNIDGNYKTYYGYSEGCNWYWYGTGIYKTYDEWEDLTIDEKGSKGIEEICNILGIPYWMKGAYEE